MLRRLLCKLHSSRNSLHRDALDTYPKMRNCVPNSANVRQMARMRMLRKFGHAASLTTTSFNQEQSGTQPVAKIVSRTYNLVTTSFNQEQSGTQSVATIVSRTYNLVSRSLGNCPFWFLYILCYVCERFASGGCLPSVQAMYI